jgi:hypothetical protein
LSSLILTELPIEAFPLLLHGQGLIDEGLMRPLQDFLGLLWIIARLPRLQKPVDDGNEGLAPSQHAGSAGKVLSALQRGTR